MVRAKNSGDEVEKIIARIGRYIKKMDLELLEKMKPLFEDKKNLKRLKLAAKSKQINLHELVSGLLPIAIPITHHQHPEEDDDPQHQP